MRFIYVMCKEDKETMIKLGYDLMKEDSRNGVWIFKNRDVTNFAAADRLEKAGVSFVLSDTLTF